MGLMIHQIVGFHNSRILSAMNHPHHWIPCFADVSPIWNDHPNFQGSFSSSWAIYWGLPGLPKFCWHNMFFIGCGSIPTSLEVLEIWTQMIHHDPPVFFFGRCSPGYQLANIQKAIENGHRNSWFILIYPLNIVIFDSWFPIVMVITHSYVSD